MAILILLNLSIFVMLMFVNKDLTDFRKELNKRNDELEDKIDYYK